MSQVTELLDRRHVGYAPLHHRPVWTGLGEAVALDMPAEEVAKTVVLDTPRGHVVAVVPASRRVSLRFVRRALGQRDVSIASEAEVVRDFPEFELGALPPLSELLDAPVFVDTHLAGRRWVVFAAGSREESVRVRVDDLIELDSATVAPLTHQRPDAEDRERLH